MNQNSIIIRPAQPDYTEGLACGRYLNQAAEGFFRLMLGPRFAQIIAAAFPQPNHSYSFQNVTFAEYDNHIAGMILGYTAQQYHRFNERPITKAAGFRACQMAAVKLLCAPMIRILSTVARGDYYILALAVDRDLRGRGIATALMNATEQYARTTGATQLSLAVAAKNQTALNLYQHRNMTIESKWPKHIPIPGIKIYRMIKVL
ncbi:MAG: GNAT family N-acetyltransferase [Planctomycetes bacterium]|nr:GNAT family N-acetyltransferase [Planctomycetota bacterium]